MRLFLLLLIFFLPLVAQKLPLSLPDELTVDLANPVFKEGILTTDEGGVIQAQGMRLQARHVRYFSKTVEGEKISYVEAWGDLCFERGDDIFTGEFLEFDFSTGQGSLKQGRGSFGLWYGGGDLVYLCQDGSYTIDNGFVTTCEDPKNDWALKAKKVRITPCGYLNAHNVTIWLGKTLIFWLPNFQTDLHSLRDSPIEYRNEVGGGEATRVGVRYRFFSKQDLRAYLRAEYLLLRGPAMGIETEYEPSNSSTRAYTQSYIARDHSLADPNERLRWRMAGHYEGCPLKHRTTQARFDYDWLSDPELASDYRLDDFNLHTARQTQLELIQQTPDLTFNSFVRARVNTFQTINQELPTFSASSRPKLFGRTGIIAGTRASVGYQDFVFARPSKEKGFHSSRLFLNERLYRPFYLGSLACLPELQATAIYYNQSQQHDAQLLASCEGNFETHFRLF
ncbi:MAG: LPS-assembly protein LptD, partial [Verrucomicrobia bacterium]|nr:LPS-assembly protein LptD [Verrucomicrobiota bacterium]